MGARRPRNGGFARDGATWLASLVRLYLHLWASALLEPWVCFREFTVERDQTRAMGFVMVVIAGWALVGVLFETISHPVIGGFPTASLIIWITFLVLVVAPAAIHLLALVATLVVMAIVRERAGVSQTVQVMAYAMAPAVLVPIPLASLQVILALYGGVLVVYGLRVVHETSFWRALLAGIVPAYLLYGLGFGTTDALQEVLRALTII